MPTLLQQQLILAWIKHVFSGPAFPQKSRIQSLHFILDLKQFVFPSFDDGFFTLYPLSKLLWLSWTSLFCLSRSNFCWWILPGRFDILLCALSGISLALPWCIIATDAVCGWSVPTISSALATRAFPGTAASLTKTSFWLFQCNFILLYVTVQRLKVFVAILTDLNLLPYQTTITQGILIKVFTSYNWI